MSVRERVDNETGRAPRASGRIPGSTSTSTLLEHGLADDVRLIVYPVLLGTEKHVLAEGTPPRSFELVRTKAMPSGIILSTFKLVGALKIT